MKNEKRVISKNICLIIFIQIFILINMIFAGSYLISHSLYSEEDNLFDDFSNKIFKSIADFFSIKEIGIVSGVDINVFCCEKTKEGGICENLVAENIEQAEEQCIGQITPTDCEHSSNCKLGCCIDMVEGLCTPKSPRQKCIENEGFWEPNELCGGILECSRGCCNLINNYRFTTKKECELISSQFGIETNFDYSIYSEYVCLSLKTQFEEGACVFENKYEKNDCERRTENECERLGGDFYIGQLCTNPYLNTKCEKTENTMCLEDGIRDGVYFMDSCRNIANIYDSSKISDDSYWNEIRSISESCNSENGNINSIACGNCRREYGSICASSIGEDINPDYGENYCRSLNCKDAPTRINNLGEVLEKKDRYNGESWCLYDASIGVEKSPFGNDISTDPVGSLHWRASCINGEVRIENCGDSRTEVCTQQDIYDPNSDFTFSIGSCVKNEAILCLKMNMEHKEGKLENKCNENPQCLLKKIKVDEKFKFNMCVPKYPIGFDLKPNEKSSEGNKGLCSLASIYCPVVFKKNWKGKWKCEDNCECLSGDYDNVQASNKFLKQMNDLCVSLGDCGSYINYVGVGTENYKTNSGGGSVNSSRYLRFKETISGKFIHSWLSEENKNKLIAQNLGDDLTTTYESEDFEKFIQGIQGAGAFYTTAPAVFNFLEVGGMTKWGITGPWAGAIVGAAIGAFAGELIANWLGYQGESRILAIIGGAIFGGALGYTYIAMAQGLATIPIGGWIAIVIVTILLLSWGEITGWGEIETKNVKFKCYPWQPPKGEQNCELCNDDPLGRSCTEYKCNSLGQTCEFINEYTENPECISTTNDGIAPKISPNEIITKDFEFNDEVPNGVKIEAEIEGNDGRKCINSFTPLIFRLETDKHAQCKYFFGTPSETSFEDMEGEFPNVQNAFLTNHTFVFNFASIDFISSALNLDENSALRRDYANMRVSVRCQDYWGNFNVNPYLIEFCIYEDDLTPVDFNYVEFEPLSNTYLKYNTSEKEIKMFLPEPARCRYSENSQPYEDMENNMTCERSLYPIDPRGWICETTLKNLSSENNFYIKCNDSVGNLNEENFEYKLYVSEEELKISSISSKEAVIDSNTPILIDFIVNTKGGAKKGESICKYGFNLENCEDASLEFSETNSKIHKQIFNQMNGGLFDICIKCEDIGGNIDTERTELEVIIDNTPPKITRIYKENEKIYFFTDEEAQCAYTNINCNFDFEVGNKTENIGLIKHSIEIKSGKTYYIKCKDAWENINLGCAGIIKPTKSL